MHKGLSGFGLRVTSDQITKWTKGVESSPILEASCMAQMRESFERKLNPFETVEIYSFKRGLGEFSFSMPKLPYASGFTTDNKELVRQAVLGYFKRKPRSIISGFKKVIIQELNKFEDSPSRREIIDLLKICSDEYVMGPYHGDLGFANMLVDKKVYLIDFTHSFIHSPFIDVVMMGLSLGSEYTKPWHVDLHKEVVKLFRGYDLQIEIIKRTKQLGFK